MMNILDDIKLQYKTGGIANKIIYWNVGIFLLSYIFSFITFNYLNWVALSSELTVVLYKPWTLLTYAFFHNGFLHLFFNMMILHFSSRFFLTFFTQKQYLGLYVLSAVFAGLSFVISFHALGKSSMMVGASAAIMAILVAVTTYQPLLVVRMLLIGYIKLWHITAVILLLDLLQIGIENTGGHIAHLSGALFGFIYIKLLQNGTDLSKIVTVIIDFFVNLFQRKSKKGTPFKRVHVNRKNSIVKKESKIVMKSKTQQQIDDILDKISQSGYDSLTTEEKDFLFRAGK